MKTFNHDGRTFNVKKDARGLILIAPGRSNDYQPADCLTAEIQRLAAERLTAKRPAA